jgi:hypothetical protein
MLNFYRRSFGKAGALAYLGEGAVHVYILFTNYRLADIPFLFDWFFAVLATYCGIGLLWFAYTRQIQRRRCCDTWAYVITTMMTVGPVALHATIISAHDHSILRAFPKLYSVLGLVYCSFFVWWLWTLRVERSNV